MDVMTDVAAVPDDEEDDESGRRPISKELWFLVVVALALALLMKTFLIQAFFIPSSSMEQTLHGCPGCQGDRVLVNKVVYKFREVHRGEIVVFNGKGTNFQSEGSLVEPPRNLLGKVRREVGKAFGMSPDDKDFIKRVIGVSGDVVACCADGKVTVNGQPIDEPYVHLSAGGEQGPFGPVTVPEGELFLMGDHRDGSSDSRVNGPVPVENVVGRAFAVFYPHDRLKVLRVPGTFDAKAAEAAPAILGFAMAVPITVVRRRLRATGD